MLFSEEQYSLLIHNGIAHQNDHDAVPCVSLKGMETVWIISEICPNMVNTCYGLFYDKKHKPAIGFISLDELNKLDSTDALFNDPSFDTEYKLSVFKAVADEVGQIISDDNFFADRFEKYSL